MGVKHVEAFRDSLLVMKQVVGICLCFDGSLNAYLDKYLEIIALFDDFTVQHIFRDENTLVNDLAQPASGFWSNHGKLYVLEKMDVLVCQTGWSGFCPMQSEKICSTKANLSKPNGSVSETRWFRISNILDKSSGMTTSEHDNWRTCLVRYLENPGHIADRKAWWQALKYVMLNNTLYRWTTKDLLLKYVGLNQSKIAMGEVQEGICGTHQSAHKIKWLLRRASFYWPTMINDYFTYYKGCESCQKFGDV
jgi:hypothetical protein